MGEEIRTMDLKTDTKGNVVMEVVTGWTTGIIAEIEVLLAIEHRSADPSAPGKESLVQLGLTAPQALELSEILRTLANRILHPPVAKKTH